MGIEKLGPDVLHLPYIYNRRKDETHKMLHRFVALMEDYYVSPTLKEQNLNNRIDAESARISDVSKVNRKGLNAPAPNVHYYERPYAANINAPNGATGAMFSVLA